MRPATIHLPVQDVAALYQAHQAANGLPVEPFEALAAAQKEADWRAGVWATYQAIAEKMSEATTSPVLSHIDNRVHKLVAVAFTLYIANSRHDLATDACRGSA
jgi:hypothetical protein